jgi:hypothetical protein
MTTPAVRRKPVVVAAARDTAPRSASRPRLRAAAVRPSATRIVCWQAIAALSVAAGAGWTWWVTPAALLIGAPAAIPVRGVWLSTAASRWARLQVRRTRAARPLPVAGTAEVGGEQVGVVSLPDALVVVLRAGRADLAALVAAARAHRDDPVGPRCELRVVRCRRPVPRTWLVVRARRDADHPGDTPLRLLLANILRRLRRGGLDVTPLSPDEINATTAALTGTGPVREDWHAWRSGATHHIGLRVDAPGTAPLQRLLLGDADVTVAVRARGDRLTGVLLAGTGATADRLRTLAPGLGIHLERLDGRHGPAVCATLPIGGTLP